MRSLNARDESRILGQRFVIRVLFGLLLAPLVLAPVASKAVLLGDQIYLNVTTIDPPDIQAFDGVAVIADAAVDFTFDDFALDSFGVPKYVWDVDFTGPDGLTVVITATRNTPQNDINGHFRSFEFTGINWLGDPMVVTNATVTGISGSQAQKWQAGATITEVGSDFFTFETGSWNSGGVVQGDTIIATIQLELQNVSSTGDTYEYDALGRLTRVNYPGGSSVVYTYDRAGNIVRVPEPGTLWMLFAGILALGVLDRCRRRRERIVGRRLIRARHAAVTAIILLGMPLPSPSFAQGSARTEGRSGWREAIRERIADGEYEVSWQQARLRKATEAWQAPNRAQNFRTHFMDEGIRITPREEAEDSWEFGLSFLSYGRGGEANRAERGTPRTDGKRVRYQRGDIVEWFSNERRGLEQGFTLREPPRLGRAMVARSLGARAVDAGEGLGPVYVALKVDGDARAELASDLQSVRFFRAGSPIAIAHYDHLEVTDAHGRVLESWMEVFRDDSGRGIRLVFDDTDAAYPVEIDPLLTTPGWTFEGNQAAEGLGFSVAGAGDVNNDGFADVLVGAPWYDGGNPNSGRAYLFLGGPSGLSAVPAWFAIGELPIGVRGAGPTNSRFGYAVESAGDVDGDSYDDILVSSVPLNGLVLPGQVFLYRGSPTGPSDVADWTLIGNVLRRLGTSIAGAGDLNNDGFGDIVVGEPGRLNLNGEEGRVYVFYGNDTLTLGGGQHCVATTLATGGASCDGIPLVSAAGAVWGEGGSNHEYGDRVAAAGDVNCDGTDDLVLGQPRFADNDRGRVQVYLGSNPGGITPGAANFDYEVWGDALTSNFDLELGRAIVAAGDIDVFTDGLPPSGIPCSDILIGAPGRDSVVDGIQLINNGAVYVLEGGESFPSPGQLPVLLAEGTRTRETFGASLANVGDVDGDAAADFLVGAPGEPNFAETAGRAYLLLGPKNFGDVLTGNAAWRADGAETNDYLGSALDGVGDVDGDGFDDLIIGSASAREGRSTISEVPPTRPGAAFVFYGTARALLSDLLGLDVAGLVQSAFAWIGGAGVSPTFTSGSSAAISGGSSPGSLIISTGLAQDGGNGATDWDSDGLPDKVLAGLILDVPANAQTLRFTTQYLTSDPAQEPRAEARIAYKYDPTGLSDINDLLVLDTKIERAGSGKMHAPISHAIDVSAASISQVGLQILVTEQVGPAVDTAVVLSKVFFSDLPLPGYLSDAVIPARDTNTDGLIDYVTNPVPNDVSSSAGPFRYGVALFDVPGKLIPFQLSLSYASERTREEQLGPKWSHSFASTLLESADVDPVDGCPDSVFVWLGAGQVEVYDGADDTGPGTNCEFTSRYPGGYSRLDVPPSNPNQYRHLTKNNFESTFEEESAGSRTHRRLIFSHPNLDQQIVWSYDAASGDIASIRDSRGEEFLFAYDAAYDPQRLVSVTGPGAQVNFGYSELGYLASVTDANGLETTFTYADGGNLLTITDADGVRFVTNQYESFAALGIEQTGDRVVRQQNANPGDLGRLTTYRGDELEILDREGGLRLDRYDVFGRLVESRVLLDSSGPSSLEDCTRSTDGCAVWSYAYNEQNLRERVTDPLGVVMAMDYDAQGNVIRRTEDAGGVPTRMCMYYDGRNNLEKQLVARVAIAPPPDCPLATDPDDLSTWLITRYTYDPARDYLFTSTVLSLDDPLGRTTTFTYNEESGSPQSGFLYGITDAAGGSQSFTYDSLGSPRTRTDQAGQTTTYTHDLMGRRTSTTDRLGNTSRSNFDAGGRVVSTVSPLLDTDGDGQVDDLVFESFTYDARGRPLTRKDGSRNPATDALNLWTRSYTPTGRVAAEADPEGNSTQYAYDSGDRLVSTTDPRGFGTTRSYDAAGRLVSITNPFDDVYAFRYDKAGNVRSETGPQVDPSDPCDPADPGGSSDPCATQYRYDGQGRKTSERYMLGGATFESLFSYDTRGQLLTRTEPAHPVLGARVWGATYTDTGEIASTADPEGVSTTFTYDEVDRLDLETQDQIGRVTDYDYDPVGRLTEVRVSVGGELLTSVTATYDAAGNALTVTDPKRPLNDLFTYGYDALNRITSETDGLGYVVLTEFEGRGLVAARTNARGQVLDFGYDNAGRQSSLSATDTTGSWAIAETLDESGNSTASTVSTDAAISVQRSFDGLDRQTSRVMELPTTPSPMAPSVGSEYDAAGNLSAVIYSSDLDQNGSPDRVEYEYDARNRLRLVRDWAGNETTYAYDEVGNPIGMTRPNGSTASYDYDRAGRLLSIVDISGATTIFGAQFTLDAAGRRVDIVDGTRVLPLDPTPEPDASFTYDDANRLVGRNGETFGYDEDGNLTSGSLDGSPRVLAYNALNQLVEISSGAGLETIRYDADGRRASREVGGVKTYYLYDTAGRLIEELDESGTVLARYVHGLGLISREEYDSGGSPVSASVYHYDSRGSTVALTDLGTGAITDRYAYTAYGDVQRDPTNSTDNPFTYNGRDGVVDDGNGLYFMQARYYAPELMRFIQQDPAYEGELGRPQSLNRYAFVEGNPIEKIDPTGEFGFLGAIVGAVAGATLAFVAGEDLEGILTSAAAGAVIGATGGAGLAGAALGGGLQIGSDLATGGFSGLDFSDFAVGAAAGALTGGGIGGAIAGGAFAGFAQSGNLESRLKSGIVGGVLGGALGAAGQKVGGKLAKTGLGKKFANTGIGNKVVKLGRATRNLASKSGQSASRGLARRGAVLSISRGAIVKEGFESLFLQKGSKLGRFLNEEFGDAILP